MDAEVDWDARRAGDRTGYGSEDRLLLAEANHRATSEIAAALAALHLVKAARGSKARWRLLAETVERLNGSAAVHAMLAAPPAAVVDAAGEIERLCHAVSAARYSALGGEISLDLPMTHVDGKTGRRLCLIASELITNALRHVIAEHGGRLDVTLRTAGSRVVLTVCDHGMGIRAAAGAFGTGRGGRIVLELVARSRGSLRCRTGTDGTQITVILPFDRPLVEERHRHG